MVDISVVLPTLCTGERPVWAMLRRAVDSWLDQSLSGDRYEVIVVDRASDPPVDLALPADDARLRVVRTEKSGLCHAFNRGLEEARGRYVYLAGDDGIADPSILEANLRQHAQRQDLIVWSRVARLQWDGDVAGWLKEVDDPGGFSGLLSRSAVVAGHADIEVRINERFFERSRVGWLAMDIGHQSVSRAVLQDIGGFDEGLDPLGWYAAIDLGIRLRAAGLFMVTQRRHPVIQVPVETLDDYLGSELEYFVHLFRTHRLPELFLVERYYRDRPALLDLEHLVERLALPPKL